MIWFDCISTSSPGNSARRPGCRWEDVWISGCERRARAPIRRGVDIGEISPIVPDEGLSLHTVGSSLTMRLVLVLTVYCMVSILRSSYGSGCGHPRLLVEFLAKAKSRRNEQPVTIISRCAPVLSSQPDISQTEGPCLRVTPRGGPRP